MANPIGTFGSTVGARAPKPKPFLSPLGTVPKIETAHYTKAPTVHVSALHPSNKSLGISTSSGSATDGWSGKPATYAAGSGGASAGSIGGSFLGDVSAFIGHLGSDVVHTTEGIPAGLVYMANHPIAGAEGAIKATWADWSPLFHGNLAAFGHNFFEHPLGPILDLAGFATLGAGTAARVASFAGKIGEASAGADAAAAAADAATAGAKAAAAGVRAASGAKSAFEAGKAAGAVGIDATTTAQKLLRFGKASTYAWKGYSRIAENLGFIPGSQEFTDFVNLALKSDPTLGRTIETAGKIERFTRYSDNPWTKLRQAYLGKVVDAAALTKGGQLLHIDKFVGAGARLKQWTHIDKGIRRTAMRGMVGDELRVMHAGGGILDNMPLIDRMKLLHSHILSAIVGQSHAVDKAKFIDPVTGVVDQAAVEALMKDGYQFVKANHEIDHTAINEHLAEADKVGTLEAADKAWSHVLKRTGDSGGLYGKSVVINDPLHAMEDANGQLRVISSTAVDSAGKEALWGGRAMQILWRDPIKVWRYMLLGVAPRYFVNNFVGNGLMLMAATDPVTMFRAFRDHFKGIAAEEKAFGLHQQAIIDEAGAKVTRMTGQNWANHPINVAARHEVGVNQFRRDITGAGWKNRFFAKEYGMAGDLMNPEQVAGRDGKYGTDVGGRIHRLNSGKYTSFHYAVNKYADMPFRNAALQTAMSRMPEYQAAYASLRKSGMAHWEASNKAAEMAASSPVVRQLVREQVHHMLGQYHTFTKTEGTIKDFVPFYSWDRAIAKNMKFLITQQPYKVAMAASIASVGNAHRDQLFTQVPDFLLSSIPVDKIPVVGKYLAAIQGTASGRTNMLKAQNLNPYGTLGDLANTAMAAAGVRGAPATGESVGSQLNPVLQGAIQTISGNSTITGTPDKAPGHSLPPFLRPWGEALGGIPEVSILSDIFGTQKPSVNSKGQPTLYQNGLQKDLTALLGVPLQQVSPQAAKYIYDKQHPKKKLSKNSYPGL